MRAGCRGNPKQVLRALGVLEGRSFHSTRHRQSSLIKKWSVEVWSSPCVIMEFPLCHPAVMWSVEFPLCHPAVIGGGERKAGPEQAFNDGPGRSPGERSYRPEAAAQ